MATTTKSTPVPGQATLSFTIRNPPYTYFHLSLQSITSQPQQDLDEIAARSYLFAALQQYLGLTGTAVPIDILKVEDQNVWIRVPREDGLAVTAALSQWVGARGVNFRIEAKGSWLAGVIARTADRDNKHIPSAWVTKNENARSKGPNRVIDGTSTEGLITIRYTMTAHHASDTQRISLQPLSEESDQTES